MELTQAVLSRWSCRAFKPDPVPTDVILDILSIASHAPSYMNTQPWEVVVVTGQKLAEVNHRRLEIIKEKRR